MADSNIEVQYKLNTQQAMDAIKQLSDAYKTLDTALTNSGTNASNTLGKIASGAKSAKDGASAMTDLFTGFSGILKDLDAPMSAVFATDKIVEFGTAATQVFSGIETASVALEATNPVGWIIAGVTALGAAMEIYSKTNSENVEIEKRSNILKKELTETIKETDEAEKQLSHTLDDYNLKSIKEQDSINKTIALRVEDSKAKLIQMTADRDQLQLDQSKIGTMDSLRLGWIRITQGWNAYVDARDKTARDNGAKAVEEETNLIDKQTDSLEKLEQLHKRTATSAEIEKEAMNGNSESISNLQAKISLLREAHEKAAIGSDDFTRTQIELTAAEKQLANATGKPSEAFKERTAILKELTSETAKYNSEANLNASDKNDADRNTELNNAKEKYDKLRALDKGNAQNLANDQKVYNNDITAINAKYHANESKLAFRFAVIK